MEKTYFVTVNAVRLANSEFHEKSQRLDYRSLIECIKIGEEDDEVVLKVPAMLGLGDIIIHEIVYDGEDTTSLDSRAFRSVKDFKKANLYYARHRLETQLDIAIHESTFDPISDNYAERSELIEQAMTKFATAYHEWHTINHTHNK